jgi:N-acetylmuramoyl-L-alanine amidase
VGSGDATLLINGQFVLVQPNGAFLAWLPVPEAEAGDTAFYRIRVRRGEEVRTYSHPILLWRPYEGEGAVWLDSAGYREPAERWALPDERLEFQVRAAPGLDVHLDATAARYLMREGPNAGAYSARIGAAALRRAACDERCAPIGALDSLALRLVAKRNGGDGAAADSADIRFALPLRVLVEDSLPVVELFEPVDSIHGNNGVIVGRPLPSGTFHWRFPAGTRAEVDGRLGERLRLRLSPGLASWVRAEDAEFLPSDTPRPRGTVGNLRFRIQPDRITLGIPLAAPLPLRVSEPAPDMLVLTLYGAIGDTERISYGPTDPMLRSVDWVQHPGERFELHVRLAEPVWGYRVSYDSSDAGSAVLTLEIRRPPAIDRARPLAGRRIAIDPGHPGAGAHGPTGYYEGDANLGIAQQLVGLLSAEGAEPILIRADTMPLGLYERTGRAIAEDAELFVSIHNNALPDGVRPFGREGTSTYYFHPHSRDLAAALQTGMLRSMGLRDLGYFWGDLAVARMSWMPSALTEGAFMMMPEHEAALKTPQFQRAYAVGVLNGLRAFLAARAGDWSQ